MARMNIARRPRRGSSQSARLVSRFARETSSAAAVEFALVGVAFFFFVLGIFMLSMTQYWQMTLDDSVREAARGVALGAYTTNTQFANAVCNEFGITAPGCASIQFEVQTGSYFTTGAGNAITPAVLNSNGTLSAGSGTLSSSAGSNYTLPVTLSTLTAAAVGSTAATPGNLQVLFVQVVYPLPFTIPWLGGAFTENGTPSLISTIATVME